MKSTAIQSDDKTGARFARPFCLKGPLWLRTSKRPSALVISSVCVLLTGLGSAGAATIWSGPTITFTKANYADWTLPQNQDHITTNVWITRKDSQGIFNIKQESGYTHYDSPEGTEWAFGAAANWQTLTFTNWEDWAGSNPPSIVGQSAVLHLIDDDIYLDITFLSWTSGAGGGGFSYERTTVPEPAAISLLALGGLAIMRRKQRQRDDCRQFQSPKQSR